MNLQGFPHVVLSHARLPFRHSPELAAANCYTCLYHQIRRPKTKLKRLRGADLRSVLEVTDITDNINKINYMKTVINLRKSIFVGCIGLGTTISFLAPSLTLAEGKGASRLMFVAPTSQSQPAASKLSQMSCPRCTDGYTKVADASAKGLKAVSQKRVAAHGCSSCETKIVAVGTGKAKTDKTVHTCGNNKAVGSSCCMAAN